MIVWVLIITMSGGVSGNSSADANFRSGAAVAIIDNIASDQSCQQIAKVVRQQIGITSATCAPVRKIMAGVR